MFSARQPLPRTNPITTVWSAGRRLVLSLTMLGGLAAAAHAQQGTQLALRVPEPAPAAPQQHAGAQRVGVVAAVNPGASGTPMNGGGAQPLAVGQEVDLDEHIATDSGGQVVIWFLDGSSLSVGPDSDVVVDKFVFDPNTGAGALAMSSCRGVLRYVGGKISKHEDSVTLHTPTGNVGVRGGVFMIALARK